MFKFILGTIVAIILFVSYISWKDKIPDVTVKEYIITGPLAFPYLKNKEIIQ